MPKGGDLGGAASALPAPSPPGPALPPRPSPRRAPLERLFGHHIALDKFFEDNWDKKPLAIPSAASEGTPFDDILCLSDMDNLLMRAQLADAEIILFEDLKKTGTYASPHSAFSSGARRGARGLASRRGGNFCAVTQNIARTEDARSADFSRSPLAPSDERARPTSLDTPDRKNTAT